MAKLIRARDYWEYEYQEEAVVVRDPVRGNKEDDENLGWGYEWKPKIGDVVTVVSPRDSDHELTISPTDDEEGSYYIWDACIEPVNKPAPPIPDDVDLSDPLGIEQFLGG